MPVNKETLARILFQLLNDYGDWMDLESLCRGVLQELGRKRLMEKRRDEIDEVLNDDECNSFVTVQRAGASPDQH